ncbi:MAG: site-specific integrase [Methylacidiphilales bacterium]|nr:site-specific integrase [Candidatus Methylacidiphilales bacterium]
MGTIVARKRQDGTPAYQARVQIMRRGVIACRESKTFESRPAARAWIDRREKELLQPGALERLNAPSITLADAIDKYTTSLGRPMSPTMRRTTSRLKASSLGSMACRSIRSQHIVEFAQGLRAIGLAPATVGLAISLVAPVFTVARPAWNIELDAAEMVAARHVLARLGVTGASKHRERRPTLDEMSRIMQTFSEQPTYLRAVPMMHIAAFALFSARRVSEIARILWSDLDEGGSRILIRDMKHPRAKKGNHVWCDLTPEALAIIRAMPRRDKRIFPHDQTYIGDRFREAVTGLQIEDLVFHDLRHEAISRLFEMGRTLPQVAAVSGHRSWSNLSRYTHLRQTGDRWAGWKWLGVVTTPFDAANQ